jgi:hypothetical protein
MARAIQPQCLAKYARLANFITDPFLNDTGLPGKSHVLREVRPMAGDGRERMLKRTGVRRCCKMD